MRIDTFLLRPAYNAAGHIGLARVLYGAFLCWFLSMVHMTDFTHPPDWLWHPAPLFSWMHHPSDMIIMLSEHIFIAVAFLLMLGVHTRIMTVLTLLCGLWYLMLYSAILQMDAVTTVMFFYVPLCMMFSRWGHTYSIDALLRQKKGRGLAIPDTNAWQYIWPVRSMLLVLSALFFLSAMSKVSGGAWIKNPLLLECLMQTKALGSLLTNGSSLSPLPFFLANVPSLLILMQYGTLLFEALFPLVIFSRKARVILLRIAIVFHASNSIILGVPFIAVLPAYILFINWQTIIERNTYLSTCCSTIKRILMSWKSTTLHLAPYGFALIVSLLWNNFSPVRWVFSFGYIFDGNRAVWIALSPFIFIWIVRFRRGRGECDWHA